MRSFALDVPIRTMPRDICWGPKSVASDGWISSTTKASRKRLSMCMTFEPSKTLEVKRGCPRPFACIIKRTIPVLEVHPCGGCLLKQEELARRLMAFKAKIN
eukprot:scaffold373_cov350-Pavlova_lutheri.AAC.31